MARAAGIFGRVGPTLSAVIAILCGGAAAQQSGDVVWWRPLGTEGPSAPWSCSYGALESSFGASFARLGDVDGDGIDDVAVGAPRAIAAIGHLHGKVFVLFMAEDGTVRESVELMRPDKVQWDAFGTSVAELGDVDGDGVRDLAIGDPMDGFSGHGAIYIALLSPDGSVHTWYRIGSESLPPGLPGFHGSSNLGGALAGIGDHDGDGIPDLALSVPPDPGTVPPNNGVFILHLQSDGVPRDALQLALPPEVWTGELAALGDLDGDGVQEVALGAGWQHRVWIVSLHPAGAFSTPVTIAGEDLPFPPTPLESFGDAIASGRDPHGTGLPVLWVGAPAAEPAGGVFGGSVHQLVLLSDGSVASQHVVSATQGNFQGWTNCDRFGSSILSFGDVDGDGLQDIAVASSGSYLDGKSPSWFGRVWLLSLNDGTVVVPQKVRDHFGGFVGTLPPGGRFGAAVCSLTGLDQGARLLVGSPFDGDRGSVWLLSLGAHGLVEEQRRLGAGDGFSNAELQLGDRFGSAVAALGDLDGNGVVDVAVGTPFDDDGSGGVIFVTPDNRGAVWVLFLDEDGGLVRKSKISATEGGLIGPLPKASNFGTSLAALGDLDGDGTLELAVGAAGHGGGLGPQAAVGAVFVLSLDASGQVVREHAFDNVQGSFAGRLHEGDRFGSALARLDDLDGDGLPELAIGAPGDDDGGPDRGAAWVLRLDARGLPKRIAKVSALSGGFTGALHDGDGFGSALAGLPDRDGDGLPELAVGAPGDDHAGDDSGASWLLSLHADGTVKTAHLQLTELSVPFMATLDPGDHFGAALAVTGDIDADGLPDLVVGAPGDGDLAADRGALWILRSGAGGVLHAGGGIAGAGGRVPALETRGDGALHVAGAPPGAPVALLAMPAGAQPLLAGGLLSQPHLLALVAADEHGEVTFAAPHGTPPLAWQAWVADPAAAGGLSASAARILPCN